MDKLLAVFICLIYCIIDFLTSTLLVAHKLDFRHEFLYGFYNYSFRRSLVDLWSLCPVRICPVFGAIVAVIFNTQDAVPSIKKVANIFYLITVFLCIFVIVKLLGLADIHSNLHDPWIWGNLSCAFIASVMCGVQWYLLTLIKVTPSICNVIEQDRQHLNVNMDCDEDTVENDDCKKEEEEEKVDKAGIWRLLAYSKPDLPYIIAAFLFLTLSSTGRIFLPYFTGQVIDGIAIEKSQTKFVHALITMSLITLGSAIFAGLRGSIFTYVLARLSLRIRDNLFSSITQQEIGFFDNIRTGDLVSRLTSDTSTMSDALALNMNIFLRSLITSIGVIVFMFKLSWRMSLVTFAGLPVIIIVSKVYGTYYETLSEKVQDSLAKANIIAEEALSTMRTVRSFANEEGENSRYYKALTITYRLGVKLAVIYGGYVVSNEVFELVLTIATFYYGGHLVITNQLTAGNLVSFILYQIQLGECLDAIGDVYTGLMQSLGASHKVFEYIDRKPVIYNKNKGYQPDRLQGRIQFQNVNFSYPTRPDTTVLKNININIEPGEIVALVGPSGGGKSSLVNLLQHFYETQSGQILLDGVKIQDYSHSYLHRKISMVGQEPVLYARTISDNISYGLEEEFSQIDIQNAAKLANAHDFITKMTKSYETETGEKGLQISGGQKQRIAIARALIRNPVVLILDEATSALDSESEHVVQQAIYSNIKGRTVLIIAHRLSTVESADRIIVIHQGQVAEEGRHEELLAKGGMYANLVKRQLNTLDIGGTEKVPENTKSFAFQQSPIFPTFSEHHRSPESNKSLDYNNFPKTKKSPQSRLSPPCSPDSKGFKQGVLEEAVSNCHLSLHPSLPTYGTSPHTSL